MLWSQADPGVLLLPSGRLVRGRALGRRLPDGPAPDFAVYLLEREPPAVAWESIWVRWPDFGLPAEAAEAAQVLKHAWRRCSMQRVEVACWGGRGRTGTALACLAILDGVAASQAVDYVRARYHADAVETPAQEKFVRTFVATAQ